MIFIRTEIYRTTETGEVGSGWGFGGIGGVAVVVDVVVEVVELFDLHSQIGQLIKWCNSLRQPSRWQGMLQSLEFVWRYK